MNSTSKDNSEIDWSHVVVLGAAGKMGRGIALLLLQEMAGIDGSILTLLDTDARAFLGLRKYLRENLLKSVEKQINELRKRYVDRSDLIDNGDMIEEFINTAMDRVRCVTSIHECVGASMIFEAIIEDIDIKSKVLSEVDHATDHKAYFFTNTSSIPISILSDKSGIVGRLIGYHFYNPPAIQKLLEVIIPPHTNPKLSAIALSLAKKLNKTVVLSGDVAGFIGNGHFIREIIEACSFVDELSRTMPKTDAIQLVNRVTQEYLVRPMGIFQLLDYVGIDVGKKISKVMSTHLNKTDLSAPLVEAMAASGVVGGQMADGSQKPGFFNYEKGKPVEVYDLNIKGYVPCKDPALWEKMPEEYIPWKALCKDPGKKEKLDRYFACLWQSDSREAELAKRFLANSRKIAHGLVKDHIAANTGDVDTVLQNGFFHLYGVEQPFLHDVTGGGKI